MADGGRGRVAHPTVAERVAAGRAARRAVPRGRHAEPPSGTRGDPIAVIEEQAAGRIPELVPIRHGRMVASAFAFYRGAAGVMAADLARTPVAGLTVQLCGDAHLSNFGLFGTPERRLVFDINDFDETLPGPFEWDVKRLAASLAIAARGEGMDEATAARITRSGVGRYRAAMAEFAAMGNLELFYTVPDVETVIAAHREANDDPAARRIERAAERLVARARRRDNLSALGRFTHEVEGEPRIAPDPPLVVPVADILGAVDAADFTDWWRGVLRGYRQSLAPDHRRLLEGYRLVDLARKVVGVGSVGTDAWIALLLGRDDGDPLVLQIKEAPPSVLERHLRPSAFRNGGRRVVTGQRLMQAAGDVFLGWIRVTDRHGRDRDFYVRQLRDWKGSVEVAGIAVEGLTAYAALCGWTLARAHARSGDRIAIAAYLGSGDRFERAVTDFALGYADLNDADHAALEDAIGTGRLAALPGV